MPSTPAFASVGRTYPSEAYELLYRASLATRAERRALRRDLDPRQPRRWHGSREGVTIPFRLPN